MSQINETFIIVADDEKTRWHKDKTEIPEKSDQLSLASDNCFGEVLPRRHSHNPDRFTENPWKGREKSAPNCKQIDFVIKNRAAERQRSNLHMQIILATPTNAPNNRWTLKLAPVQCDPTRIDWHPSVQYVMRHFIIPLPLKWMRPTVPEIDARLSTDRCTILTKMVKWRWWLGANAIHASWATLEAM